jgi:hypothetical protein
LPCPTEELHGDSLASITIYWTIDAENVSATI